MAKAKEIKSNGTYDKRKKAGRQAAGKGLHPKKSEKEMSKGLKNDKKHGK
jgi:hypothetical protein